MTARALSRALAALEEGARYRVSLRLYHGWRTGFRETDRKRAATAAIAAVDFAALLTSPAVVIEDNVGFGDVLLEARGGARARQADSDPGRVIYFNAPGRRQTKKRRSIVPICPTLAPWLDGHPGLAIQWQRRAIDRETREIRFEWLPANSIKIAFEKTPIAAGISEPARDHQGSPIWLPPRHRLGETVPRQKMVGLGSPNTLRHTISTEMHKRGVPEAKIEAAAGHRGDSTNKRHYRHVRPEYLGQFIEGVESLWDDVGKLTRAHLR